MNVRILASLALVGCCLVGGCKHNSSTASASAKEENCVPAQSAAAAQAPADTKGKVMVSNKVCPVMPVDAIPGQWADENCVVEWKGKKVGFCCPGCKPKWAKMSDADKDAALAKAM